MNLPIQAQPVHRQANAISYSAKGISPSQDIPAYAACVAACEIGSGLWDQACFAQCAPLLAAG